MVGLTGSLSAKVVSRLTQGMTGRSSDGFSPLSLRNIQAWYDASDVGSLTGTSTITVIGDKSGKGRHLPVASGLSAAPTTTVNGLNAIALDGAAHGYALQGPLGEVFAGTTPSWTVYCVFKHDSTSTDGFIWGASNLVASGNEFRGLRLQSSNYNCVGASSVGSLSAILVNAEIDNQLNLVTIRHAGSSMDSWINSFKTQDNASQSNANSIDVDYFCIGTIGFGNSFGTDSLQWKGSFCELVVQSGEATDDEVYEMTRYLLQKWSDAVEGELVINAGQSNAVGTSGATGAATAVKSGYAGNNATLAVTSFDEPIGGGYGKFDAASTGSYCGAFASKYKEITGRNCITYSLGANTSALQVGAASDLWNVSSADLYTSFNTKVNSILRSPYIVLDSDNEFIITWCQGETDATFIRDSSGTEAQYNADLDALFSGWASVFPTAKVWVIQSGKLKTGDDAGYQAVRSAQEDAVADASNAIMVYTDAVNFTSDDYVSSDNVHWNQQTLNDVGFGAATNGLSGGV